MSHVTHELVVASHAQLTVVVSHGTHYTIATPGAEHNGESRAVMRS